MKSGRVLVRLRDMSLPEDKVVQVGSLSALPLLKKIVSKHLERELDILEKVLNLSEDDAKKFYRWYMKHPSRKGIEEVVTVVGRGNTCNEKAHAYRLYPHGKVRSLPCRA